MPDLLIVDDEKFVCEGLKNAIKWEHLGFENVHTASNGEEAMEIIKLKNPSLVLSDISMPVDYIKKLNSAGYDKIVVHRFN